MLSETKNFLHIFSYLSNKAVIRKAVKQKIIKFFFANYQIVVYLNSKQVKRKSTLIQKMSNKERYRFTRNFNQIFKIELQVYFKESF